ncbi:MAG: 4-hydroxybenzoate octaprenyltransferase [Nitrospirae bacterium]|nr:MAG: 4-hydroxybenzoate octaprenyltransferase [Nitrospirota bacterium]
MPEFPGSTPPAGTNVTRAGFDGPTLARLIRLSNQSGTLLLALPTLWGLVLAAGGRPPLSLLVIFLAGSFLMRSAGVVMNDLADRSFDRQIARTQTRPLASGALSVPEALVVVAVLVSLAATLLVFVNRLTIFLSPVALLLAAFYPFSKRLVHIPQAVLGIAFGWGVIMAWTAVRNELDAPAWLLYGGTICWAVAYDTIYALQDRDEDARVGVKSSALLFGSLTWLAVALAMGGMLVLLGGAGWMLGLGPAFYATLAAVGVFFARQVTQLRGPVSPAQAFALFKQHTWVGWAILAGVWAGWL